MLVCVYMYARGGGGASGPRGSRLPRRKMRASPAPDKYVYV